MSRGRARKRYVLCTYILAHPIRVRSTRLYSIQHHTILAEQYLKIPKMASLPSGLQVPCASKYSGRTRTARLVAADQACAHAW